MTHKLKEREKGERNIKYIYMHMHIKNSIFFPVSNRSFPFEMLKHCLSSFLFSISEMFNVQYERGDRLHKQYRRTVLLALNLYATQSCAIESAFPNKQRVRGIEDMG